MIHSGISKSVASFALVFFQILTIVGQQPSALPAKTKTAEPATLAFNEFFEASARGLKPSNKLTALQNKRVRLTGFMAQMEDELEGSFFLVPRPVFCDEEGGGNADIPPEAVLVIVPFRAREKIPFVPGLIEVTGILELGNREDKGLVSSIRLIMDRS
jgi:hypothetical protein